MHSRDSGADTHMQTHTYTCTMLGGNASRFIRVAPSPPAPSPLANQLALKIFHFLSLKGVFIFSVLFYDIRCGTKETFRYDRTSVQRGNTRFEFSPQFLSQNMSPHTHTLLHTHTLSLRHAHKHIYKRRNTQNKGSIVIYMCMV